MNAKRWLTLLVLALVCGFSVFYMTACAERNRTDQREDQSLTQNSRTLVVYFTWSGHLKQMAHWIADETGADVVRILARDEYPESYSDTTKRARQEKDGNLRPAINVQLSADQMAGYDTVFVGYPIWWHDLPMPMWTFLEATDLKGKTVIPFYSHQGTSDGGMSLKNLTSLAKGAHVLTDRALALAGKSVSGSEKEVRDWVKGLKLKSQK